jgi:hypothetical protein
MSSLPTIAQLEFPQSDLTTESNSQSVHETFDWDFTTGDFKLKDGKLIKLTGIDYLKIWIQKALRTVKDSLIYENTEYGSEHHTLIGQNFHPDFSKAEYQRMLTECLLQNDAITNVDNFIFSQEGARLTIEFNVESIYGATNESVVI